MHQEPCQPNLLSESTGLESHDKDLSTDNMEPDALKVTIQTSSVCLQDNNMKTLSSCAQSNSSSQQSADFRRLAIRLGSQGSLVSVSESDGEDNDSSQDSLGEVEMMIKQVSVKNLAGEADFLSPSSPPKCKVLFEESVTNKTMLSDAAVIPRSKTPFQGLTSSCGDIGTKLNPVTPTKPVSESIDPLTPTANLKMLSSVASPEIRNREKLKAITCKIIKEEDVTSSPEEATETNGKGAKRPKSSVRQSDDDQDLNLEDPDCIDCVSQHISRKEKSLGLLCQRFLARYPEYPALFDTIEICLDEVAKDLNVERRRIYDIVNVLESVEIVSRMAKNKYVWHGKNNLSHTLSKLKALAKAEGFAEQIERIKDYEVSRELDGGGSVNKGKKMKKICAASYVPSSVVSPRKKEPLKTSDQSNLQDISTPVETVRKEKSLGIMSQKFLMLFLVSQPKTVNLDISAKILIGNPNVDRTENGKFKTKIRRLYDIANILTSLDLIRKVHVTEVRGRKPAFKYVGPNVEDIKEVEASPLDDNLRPSSKHSLLDSVQNQQVCSILNSQQCFKPISRHSLLSQPILDLGLSSDRRGGHRRMTSHSAMSKFSRHASFEQICEVAEQERNRLYFESRSQPSSPTIKRQPILPRFHSTNRGGSMSALPSSASSLKHLMVIRGAKVSEANPAEGSSSVSEVERDMRYTLVQKYPIQTITLTPITQLQSGKTDGASTEQTDSGRVPEPQMLMKAQLSQPDTTRQPTIVTLTKDQLDAVIRSLSTNSGASTTDAEDGDASGAKYVDASTQSSPQMPSGIVNLMKKLDDAPTKQGSLMLLGGGGGAMQSTSGSGTPCVQIIHLDCSSAATTVTSSNKTTAANSHKRPLVSMDAATQVKRQRTEAFPLTAAAGGVAPAEVMKPSPEQGAVMTSLLNTQDAEVATITQMAVTPSAATPVTELVPSPLKAVRVESDYHNAASPMIHHPTYLPSPPKVALIGYDLASPLMHGFNDEISPVSQLNTPPIDYILQQPLDETSVQGGASFVFQFPASTTGVTASGATMPSSLAPGPPVQPTLAPRPPMQSTLAPGPSQCSQPNTPTFRLSSTSSPIMLLQSRHSDATLDDGRLPLTPLQQYLALQPPIKSRPPARTLTGGNVVQSTVGYSFSGISPSTKISPLHSVSGTLGHAVFSTTKASPANILPAGGFPTGSSRPPGGYTPTSGNIVNLVPLFSSSPQGGSLKVINHSANQMHTGGSTHRLQKPIPVSLESSFSLLSQPVGVKVDTSTMNRGDYVMRTPRSFNQELMSPSQNMCTPTSSVVLANKVAATPNTFFRSTPGGMVPVSTTAYSQHVILNQNSAFQCVSPFQPVSGGVSAARRLAMTHFDPQP